jgi:twitching motility protein PilT
MNCSANEQLDQNKIWSLKKCGIEGVVAEYILGDDLSRGGLIIVGGTAGNGKTTTCAAAMVDRLRKFGIDCAAVQDPIEIDLEGRHGNGFCFQKEVNQEEEFHQAVARALDDVPAKAGSMVFIAEIRDGKTASIALRLAGEGRLVVATMHGCTIQQTIQRLIALASVEIGSSEAKELVAYNLRLVLLQQLRLGPSEDVSRVALKYSALIIDDEMIKVLLNSDALLENVRDEILSNG